MASCYASQFQSATIYSHSSDSKSNGREIGREGGWHQNRFSEKTEANRWQVKLSCCYTIIQLVNSSPVTSCVIKKYHQALQFDPSKSYVWYFPQPAIDHFPIMLKAWALTRSVQTTYTFSKSNFKSIFWGRKSHFVILDFKRFSSEFNANSSVHGTYRVTLLSSFRNYFALILFVMRSDVWNESFSQFAKFQRNLLV